MGKQESVVLGKLELLIFHIVVPESSLHMVLLDILERPAFDARKHAIEL